MLESSGFFSSPMLPIFSWELKIIAYKGSFTIPLSSKMELLCQCAMTSWYYNVTKSSIVDDLWVRDPPLVCFFFLWERLKFSQVDICIFKVKKKSTTTKCEICVFIVNFVLCSFAILTLNRWMPVGICCIHFHVYRRSRPEVFFKKSVRRIFRKFTGTSLQKFRMSVPL